MTVACRHARSLVATMVLQSNETKLKDQAHNVLFDVSTFITLTFRTTKILWNYFGV